MALDSGALLASVRNGLAINAIFLALTRLTLPIKTRHAGFGKVSVLRNKSAEWNSLFMWVGCSLSEMLLPQDSQR